MPLEKVVYFADTARVPYGPRPASEILEFNRQIVRFMIERHVKMLVVACNTSSAQVLEQLQAEFSLPMVGMIQPGATAAAAATQNGRVGLIATQGTVRSGAYNRALEALNPDVAVEARECPRLVPLIEGGQAGTTEVREALQEYLAPLKAQGVDTVILGCTHYPFVRDTVTGVMGRRVAIVDPAVQVVAAAGEMLRERGSENTTGTGKDVFYVHGNAEVFRELGSRLLGRELPPGISLTLDPAENTFVQSEGVKI